MTGVIPSTTPCSGAWAMRPSIPFSEGLKETVRWYQENRRLVGAAEARPVPERRRAAGRAGSARVMSRWLVTGAGGMLGQDLVAALEAAGENVAALTRRDLDITDEAAVHAAVRGHRPDVVVNCAAWTAVDDAESREPRRCA